ncbi:MAG: glycosyltransferase [Deinococcales bacterium]
MTEPLSVVVVHHRTPEILEVCLERLAHGAPDATVVLVDTGPDAEHLARLVETYPSLEVVQAPNHSYAHAVNLGLRRTRSRLVAHMNADVYVEPGTFPALVAALERHPGTGVVAPLARTPSGRRQDHGLPYHPHYLRLSLRPGGSVRVPWLTGCLQLIRREVLERCGGFDPSLRFYNDDMEFCLRVRAAGFDCRLVDVPVLHLGGSSTPASGAFLVEGVRGGYQLTRRFLPRPARAMHRTALWAWGTAGATLARDDQRRRAFHRIAAMARSGTFDDAPFGTTLQDLDGAFTDRP